MFELTFENVMYTLIIGVFIYGFIRIIYALLLFGNGRINKVDGFSEWTGYTCNYCGRFIAKPYRKLHRYSCKRKEN